VQAQASIRRLSGDLFGAAAERFRVRLGARVDDRVIRDVNAARHVSWQEQQLVLDLLRVQSLDDRDFAELHRWPVSGQTFVASVIGSSAAATCTKRRNLTVPFSSDACRLSASAFGGRFAASSSLT